MRSGPAYERQCVRRGWPTKSRNERGCGRRAGQQVRTVDSSDSMISLMRDGHVEKERFFMGFFYCLNHGWQGLLGLHGLEIDDFGQNVGI